MIEGKTFNFDIIYGMPGAGKDTTGEAVVKELNEHGSTAILLSTGELSRELKNRKSTYPHIAEYREMIGEYMGLVDKGELLPTPQMVKVFEHAMFYHVQGGVHEFVLPGFPRDEEQKLALDTLMQKLIAQGNNVHTREVLLMLEREEALRRTTVVRKAQMETAGIPPRKDDLDPKIADGRIDVFYQTTMDAVIHAQLGGTLTLIDASQTPEKVQADVLDVFLDHSRLRNGFLKTATLQRNHRR